MELTTAEKNARQLIMNLKDKTKKPTVSIKKFRETVNATEDDTARTVIETYYLTAARLCELNTVTNPCAMLRENTKPYGIFSEVKIVKADLNPDRGLALVLQLATAWRGRQIRKDSEADDKAFSSHWKNVIVCVNSFWVHSRKQKSWFNR
jgi:hypothetical protein